MVSFVFESVFLALIGGLIGCLIALPINGITTSTTNFQSFSEVAFAFRITPAALATGMIFAAAMGLVGGFLPALRAARQTIATSLRGGLRLAPYLSRSTVAVLDPSRAPSRRAK